MSNGKKKETCAAEGCGAIAAEGTDLCSRHQRMEEAQPCSLEHCDRPVYAKDLCEAHYRRKVRNSEKWDGPIIRTRGDLVFIATRITPEVHEALLSAIPKDTKTGKPKVKPYGMLSEIIEDWLRRKGLHPNPEAHAA